MGGRLQPFEGGAPRKFCENMPLFGGHFGIQLSLFDLFSLFTGNG